jgi:hypothetical protein
MGGMEYGNGVRVCVCFLLHGAVGVVRVCTDSANGC